MTYLDTTRLSYDTVAADYAELLQAELAGKPLDRALLATFVELVQATNAGPVADLGCGPGRVTAYLHELGLTTFGVDLSPRMVEVARRSYPHLRFDEGMMSDLDLSEGVLGGIVAWYSIIHTPTERLPAVFAEFHRVLAPGGQLLLAFQAGDELLYLSEAFGHPVSLEVHHRSPELVAEMLAQAGFVVSARVVREPDGWEKTPQAYLIAGKPPP